MAKEYSKYLRDTIREYSEANTFFKRILRKDNVSQNVQSTLQKVVNENRMFLHVLHFELENIYVPFPVFKNKANKNPLLNPKNKNKEMYKDLIDEIFRRRYRIKNIEYEIYTDYSNFIMRIDPYQPFKTSKGEIETAFDYSGNEMIVAIYLPLMTLETLEINKERIMSYIKTYNLNDLNIKKVTLHNEELDLEKIWNEIRKKVEENV